MLCGQQFARELRVEVAPRVDITDERGARVERLLGRHMRVFSRGLQLADARLPLARGGAGRRKIGQTALVLREALPVLLGKRRDETDGLAELPQIGRREQESRILAATEFVQRDHAGLQIGQGCIRLRSECGDLLVECGKLRRTRADLGSHARQLGRADLALDFKTAQIAEQGALLRRQAVGLTAQGLQPIGRSPRPCLGPFAIRFLRQQHAAGKGKDGDAGNEKAAGHPCAAEYSIAMRILALDVGRRRIGLAISDPSGTLARPHSTVQVSDADAVDLVAREVLRLAAQDDGVGRVVVGLPRRLDGSASDGTAAVEQFIAALRMRIPIDVVTEDERLSSREAESRLAVRERDWKKRKKQLDAAAAAVILQDYLDRRI